MEVESNSVNPLGTMMSTMAKHGADVELRQKMPDGSYQRASDETMRALGAQARIATTAQGIETMTKSERSEWAIHMKNRGNEYYANREFEAAITSYMEALTAADFGKSEEEMKSDENEGNVDEVVVPMLCNLAACCIQLKEYGKVVKFCEQCLLLRPNCARAIVRRGTALLHLGEYKRSKRDLQEGLELTSDLAEKGRIKILLSKAEKCVSEQEKALARRKKAVATAFAESGTGDERTVAAEKKMAKKNGSRAPEVAKAQNNGVTIGSYVVAFGVMAAAVFLFYILLENV